MLPDSDRMTYQYFLNTNILSDLVRHPQGQLSQKMEHVGEAGLALSTYRMLIESQTSIEWKFSDIA